MQHYKVNKSFKTQAHTCTMGDTVTMPNNHLYVFIGMALLVFGFVAFCLHTLLPISIFVMPSIFAGSVLCMISMPYTQYTVFFWSVLIGMLVCMWFGHLGIFVIFSFCTLFLYCINYSQRERFFD